MFAPVTLYFSNDKIGEIYREGTVLPGVRAVSNHRVHQTVTRLGTVELVTGREAACSTVCDKSGGRVTC